VTNPHTREAPSCSSFDASISLSCDSALSFNAGIVQASFSRKAPTHHKSGPDYHANLNSMIANQGKEARAAVCQVFRSELRVRMNAMLRVYIDD
jgi:hypothetical protein